MNSVEWDWEFLPLWQPLWSLELAWLFSFPFSQPRLTHEVHHLASQPTLPHPFGPLPWGESSLPAWLPILVPPTSWVNVSLIPWLLEFHAVWFSVTSGCLLFLDWLLSSFWLCKEAKGFYLHLLLGQNSPTSCFCSSTFFLFYFYLSIY